MICRFSKEAFKRTADSYRRIRNTARFMLSNLYGFNPETDLLPQDELLSLDRWIISEAARLQEEIKTAYDIYQFHLVYQKNPPLLCVGIGWFLP